MLKPCIVLYRLYHLYRTDTADTTDTDRYRKADKMKTFQLEKYNGRNSRHCCPKCGDPHSFTYYIDEAGNVLNRLVGRCNHESGCGYHYTPKEYFQDNPTIKPGNNAFIMPRKQDMKKDPDFIPSDFVGKSLSYKSTFVEFLCSVFDKGTLETPTVERLMNDYYLGATKDRNVIFWQIDKDKKVRTGKIIKYDPETGHRIKDVAGINWVHSILKKKGMLPDSFNLSQCLFGEHLLKKYPDKAVALVESEKTALLGAGFLPDFVWLATGGKSQLSIDKMKVLSGRTVVMYPDVDGYELWMNRSAEFRPFCNVVVSDILERNATPEERERKIDIGDWLILQAQADRPQQEIEKSDLERLVSINPAINLLIKTFDLVEI